MFLVSSFDFFYYCSMKTESVVVAAAAGGFELMNLDDDERLRAVAAADVFD